MFFCLGVIEILRLVLIFLGSLDKIFFLSFFKIKGVIIFWRSFKVFLLFCFIIGFLNFLENFVCVLRYSGSIKLNIDYSLDKLFFIGVLVKVK